MQIDLFKSRRRESEMSKTSGYIMNRKFELDPNADLNEIRKRTNCTRSDVVEEYIDSLTRRIQHGREYESIGHGIASDNLFDAEALGLGMYAKKYQIVLNFENCLDYFLHSASGCSVSAIRNIEHYNEISSAFLRLQENENAQSIKFSSLYGLDPKLDDYFMSIEKSLKDRDEFFGDDFVEQLAYEIVVAIHRIVTRVQDYVIVSLSANHSDIKGMVCRSRSFSSLIFTCDHPVTEQIILTCDNCEDLIITPRCYEKYEYATKEVLVCANCERCK